MPILWRYLLRSYFQVFSLCVTGFIAVLLVTRFQDIARFAATGAPSKYLLQFILYQVPFILPLAIPISCLIAAFILFQHLSRAHELTAMRAAGLGILPIALPLALSGLVIALINFTCASELAPLCRSRAKSLAYEMTAVNPLCLLSKSALIKLKDTHIEIDSLKAGRYAEGLLLVQRNLSHERLALVLAQKLSLEGEDLVGKGVVFISSMDPKNTNGSIGFDHLIIENEALMRIKSYEILQYLRSTEWNFGDDYLPFRLLLAKEKRLSNNARQEVARRLSLGLAPFSFTLIGIGFGMEIGRARRLKSLLWGIGLASFYMIAFIAARSMKHYPLPSALVYLLPHFVIFVCAFRAIQRISKGQET